MKKRYERVVTVCLLVLFILSGYSALAQEPNAPNAIKRSASVRQRRVAPAISDVTVVARVGDQKILGGELRKRWIYALQPNPYVPISLVEPIDVNDVLLDMMSDILLAKEGRKQGLHKSEEILSEQIASYKQQQLYQLALKTFVYPRVKVDEQEIKTAMAANSKLNEKQAHQQIGQAKAKKINTAFFRELKKKLAYTPITQNFEKAAKLHKRLLLHPRTPRSQPWILNKQIREELSDEEKAIVLVEYKGGAFTVMDFFRAIGRTPPNGRPKELSTAKGVSTFVNKAIQAPLYQQAAINAKLDQRPDYKVKVQKYVDRLLQNSVRTTIRKSIKEPNESDLDAYCERIKDHFGHRDMLKVHTLWCRTKAEAIEAKKAWESNADVNDLIVKYAFDKELSQVSSRYFSQEGLFWERLWDTDPNCIVGPILGFYTDRNRRELTLKWRVVKILEKQSESPEPLTDNARNALKYELIDKRVKEAIKKKTQELLKEYSHEIYQERLEKFSPFRVP